MNKVLITGSTGFVGSYLQEYLKSNCKIDVLSARYRSGQQFEIISDAIIHLAGKAHDLKNVSKPEDYYEANYELTKQLFDAFLISESSVFIFMSTVKAAADEVKEILTEDVVPNPKSHYGISKYNAEKYILSKKIPTGKRFYILRPCMIHGPGNKGNLNLLYELVKKGFPWPLGAFENQRSFLTIENLGFVVKELLDNQSIASGIYNVADDKSLSTNELIKLLGYSLNKKIHLFNLSKNVIKSIAKLGDYLYLPLNSERLQKLTESYLVSNKKILNAINKSLPVSAEDGLKRTFASFND